MMKHLIIRQPQVLLLLAFLVMGIIAGPAPVRAGPTAQDDPVAQCAEGVQFFLAGRAAEAALLLEAGFAGRNTAEFVSPDDLGACALALGFLRYNTGNLTGALQAYAVALDIFQAIGDRQLEGTTLSKISAVYDDQGRYAEALDTYQQALAILREVDDRAGEGTVLNDIGLVYRGRGRYDEALEVYQQALAILREVDDRAGEGTTLNNIGVVYQSQGRYSEALDTYQQALAIRREVGDRAGEGTTLNNIGAVYRAQGRYAEALDIYEQALTIRREVDDRAGEGTTLSNIGAVYKAQGRFAEALDIYEQALAIAQDVGVRAGEGTMLNNIGGVYHSQGRYSEALEIYQQALAIRREVGDQAGEGTTLNSIGGVYSSQGRYSEALEIYQQALTIRREVGDRAGEGTTLNNIGAVYDDQGRYAEALETFQQALAIRHEVGDRAGEGGTLNNIGGVYADQGRYVEALETYQQALAIGREVGDRAGEGTTLNNIGAVYVYQGRYAEALEAFEQALAIVRAVGDRTVEGTTLNNIGAVYVDQGRYAEAMEAYKQALTIAREVGDRAGEGTTLNNIGVVYRNQGRYGEALDTFQQALAIRREVGDRAGEGTTLNNIGGVYDSQGRYDEALEAYEKALVFEREVGDRAGEGGTLNNIGAVYADQGRHAEALEPFQQALVIAREVGDRAGEGTRLNNIGAVYRGQGRYGEALNADEQALEALESVRSVAGGEAGRSSFVAQYSFVYERSVDLYHQQGQDDRAFFTSERGRARTFLDGLATGHVELSDNAAAELLAAEQEAYAVRRAAQDALAKARSLDPRDPALVADLEAQLAAAEQEHQVALDAIGARGGQLVALVPGRSGVLDLAAVQALLDDQTTLVSYWVLGDKGALAFVVTGDSFTTVELPDATSANLASAVDNTLSWRNPEQAHPKPLRDLYTWLVAPLAEQLQTPQVVIVPHQQLQYVPFAALDDGQTYFGQQHLLSVIPSASALPFIQQNAAGSAAKANTQALVFGNPTTGDPSLPSLVHAATEAKAVASLLGTVAVTDAEASETRLRDEAAGSKVIHLAAHGGYNVANPLYSAIYLAPGGEGAAGDGRLETHEVYGLDLKGNELVVLSACQTNVGELSAGDELVGMTRAFLFAGTPTILSSLWSVDDEATDTLMTAFYRHWLAGMGKAEALQAAQAEVRGNSQWASPFYWAGFVLNGDPGANTAKVSEPAAQPAESPNSPEPTTSITPQQPGRSLLLVLLVVGALALGLAALTIGVLRRRSSA